MWWILQFHVFKSHSNDTNYNQYGFVNRKSILSRILESANNIINKYFMEEDNLSKDGDLQLLLPQGVGKSITPFAGLLHFTLDPHLIMLRVKQWVIRYHFLNFWYNSTWDWTPVSRAIDENYNHYANRLNYAYIQSGRYFHRLEYSDFCLHCYIHNFSVDASFRHLQVFLVEPRSRHGTIETNPLFNPQWGRFF